MNYKELFKITIKLISSPAKAWEEISLEEDKRNVYMTFVYPMIGLCGLSVFIGSLLDYGWGGPQSFQIAMTVCCAVAVSLFGGYFLAAYLINQIGIKMLGMDDDIIQMRYFAGYAMIVIFSLDIITGILPAFRIIGYFLQMYTFYIVWEGAPLLLGIQEKNRLRFTIIASVLLMVCPWIIQIVFNKLIVVLN